MSANEQKDTVSVEKNPDINVNADTEASVINLLVTLFNPIAYMEPSTVRYNIERASVGGFSKEDRSMRIELGNFFINHFSVVYFGIIANETFRDALKEAVSVEIALDEKDAKFIEGIRNDMKYDNKKPQKPSKGNYTLNFSEFNEDFYKKLNGKLLASFEKTSKYDEAMDEMAHELTDENMLDIGFIASNFAYLYRSLAKNELFAHYVKTVVHSVEVQLGIE